MWAGRGRRACAHQVYDRARFTLPTIGRTSCGAKEEICSNGNVRNEKMDKEKREARKCFVCADVMRARSVLDPT